MSDVVQKYEFLTSRQSSRDDRVEQSALDLKLTLQAMGGGALYAPPPLWFFALYKV